MEATSPATDTDTLIIATAYRFSGILPFCARVNTINDSVIVASVEAELHRGELVFLQCWTPGHILEMYCRVENCVGGQCKFVLLSLKDRQ